MFKNRTASEAKRSRRWGDRADGWRVISSDALFSVIPHIMDSRCDSQVFFDQTIEIGELEKFVRNLRHTTTMTELSTLHLIMAACVRMIAQYPCVNRFVCGRRIYARNHIVFAFNIKKDLTLESEEAILKVEFDPTDTLWEVYEKVSVAIRENKDHEAQNDTDIFARLMALCPPFVVRAVVALVKMLDYFGILPKPVRDFSPFHSTMYITDVGSIGIGSVYHHLYNFGTCSMFCALGKKGRALKVNDEKQVVYAKNLSLRFTVDERIADGYYFAYTFRSFLKLLRNPEELLEKPAQVMPDPDLRKTRKERRALKAQQALQKEHNVEDPIETTA